MTDPAPSAVATPAAVVPPRPWYHRPVVVVLLLIFFFPAGLWLMWSGKVFPMAVRVIVSVLIGLVIVGNAGKRGQEREHGAGASASASSAPAVAEVVQDVDATTIVRAYDGNELAGDAAYKDKKFRISGAVESVGKDVFGSAYVTIKGGHALRTVQCFLRDNAEEAKAIKLQSGQRVTIVGTVDGLMMNVLVKNAVIE